MANEEKPAGEASAGLSLKEQRTRGQRTLFISVMLMFLVSIVVSVVFSIYFLIPRLAVQDLVLLKIKDMNTNLAMLSTQIEELKASCTPAEPAPEPGAEPSKDQPPAPPVPVPDQPKAGPAKAPVDKPK
jgi:hypothetical protein